MRYQASHGTPELRCAHWIQTETASSGSTHGVTGSWWATYTGEWLNRGPTPSRQQNETMNQEHATKHLMELQTLVCSLDSD